MTEAAGAARGPVAEPRPYAVEREAGRFGASLERAAEARRSGQGASDPPSTPAGGMRPGEGGPRPAARGPLDARRGAAAGALAAGAIGAARVREGTPYAARTAAPLEASQPPAAARSIGPSALHLAALHALQLRGPAALDLCFEGVTVRLAAAPAGVAVTVEAGSASRRSAQRELPALVRALRARGVRVLAERGGFSA